MDNCITISIENIDDELNSLVPQLKKCCVSYKHVYSCTGIEIATFFLDVAEFIAVIISLPMILDLINRKKITAKMGGIKLGDSIDEILNSLKNTPDFLEKAKNAINNETFEIEGRGKTVSELCKKLKEIINSEGEETTNG